MQMGIRDFAENLHIEQLPFDVKEKILEVEYSDELPEINPIDVLLQENFEIL